MLESDSSYRAFYHSTKYHIVVRSKACEERDVCMAWLETTKKKKKKTLSHWSIPWRGGSPEPPPRLPTARTGRARGRAPPGHVGSWTWRYPLPPPAARGENCPQDLGNYRPCRPTRGWFLPWLRSLASPGWPRRFGVWWSKDCFGEFTFEVTSLYRFRKSFSREVRVAFPSWGQERKGVPTQLLITAVKSCMLFTFVNSHAIPFCNYLTDILKLYINFHPQAMKKVCYHYQLFTCRKANFRCCFHWNSEITMIITL